MASTSDEHDDLTEVLRVLRREIEHATALIVLAGGTVSFPDLGASPLRSVK
jgi:hypothetical protein